MDRLICGDVGYGKTEVALRAAFKAAIDGRQVMFLVPTTVLTQQHFGTFTERLRDYPLRIEMASRFRSTKEVGAAVRDFGLVAPSSVQIETRVGAASLIASQLPLALSPTDPTLLKVTAPPEPRRVRAGVQNDLNALFLLLGGVSLLIGASGIANVTLVSVLERVGEIGLRRALGAARRHVAGQFLLESTTLGLLGGVLGAALGTLVVVGVAASRTWTPVLEPWVPLGAPLLGGAVGLASGIYPSVRAAAMEPVEALRSTM